MGDMPWSDYKPDRTDVRAEYEGAVREMESRKYVQAAERLEWIIEQPGGGNLEVHELLARAYYHAARLQKAEEQARKVLEIDPTNSYAVLLLGRTLERQGKKDEAKPYLARAAALGEEL